MGGVLLDSTGRPARRDRARMYVPPGLVDEDVVIVGVCNVCALLGRKTVFREGEENAWQRHVGECARANMDAIMAASPVESKRGTLWDPNTWDPEVEQHLLAVGRRMQAEGRMEIRPHERAGLQ